MSHSLIYIYTRILMSFHFKACSLNFTSSYPSRETSCNYLNTPFLNSSTFYTDKSTKIITHHHVNHKMPLYHHISSKSLTSSSTINLKSNFIKKSSLRINNSNKSLIVKNELSYIMIKPDGVQRGLIGTIITKFESKGFKLKGLKLYQCSKELAETHYQELKEKPFFKKLVDYIVSGPVVCMVWEGNGVVAAARTLIGKTDPLEALPGTIRGDFGIDKGRNVVHGSDSIENGLREIELWFDEDEIIEWNMTIDPWVNE